jgi:hypothetical protein
MAIQFVQKIPKQKRKPLFFGLVFIIVLAGAIFFWNTKKDKTVIPDLLEETIRIREEAIKINFEKLENEILKALTPFKNIVSPEDAPEGMGRENPFAPAPAEDQESEEDADMGGEEFPRDWFFTE